MKFLRALLLTYFVAFFVVAPVYYNTAEAEQINVPESYKNIFIRAGNPDLLFAIAHGYTQLSKNITGDTTSFVAIDSIKTVIAKYSPLLEQGIISVSWVHNFLDPRLYQRWLNKIKKEKLYNKIWFVKPLKNDKGQFTGQVALLHIITPQDFFKTIKAPNGTVLRNGHMLGDIDYNKIISCSANSLSNSDCSETAFKSSFNFFLQIVSEVAKENNTDQGYVVYQRTSTHEDVSKHHGFLKSKITIKYYIDSVPEYLMIVPPWAPGVTTPTSGYLINGVGYLKVDPNTAEGWDFTRGSRLFAEDTKKSWNGWVGMLAGFGGGMLSLLVPGSWGILTYLAHYISLPASTGWFSFATIQEIKRGDFGTFRREHAYLSLKERINASGGHYYDMVKTDYSDWLGCGFSCTFDGAHTVLAKDTGLNNYTKATLTNSIPDTLREQLQNQMERAYGR